MQLCKNNSIKISIFLLAWFIPLIITGQVYPGDANNNGQVDHVDVIYVGYAYGTIGPARIEADVEFAAQDVLLFWDEAFPDQNETNFAHADANGDGFIDWFDMVTVFTNYDSIGTGGVISSPFVQGITGRDPELDLLEEFIPNELTENSYVEIPINLGTLGQPVNDLNGIAFTIEYEDIFFESFEISYENSWIGADSQDNESEPYISFQRSSISDNSLAEVDVALTRFGEDPISGFGKIATVKFIIEDDLIDLLEVQDSVITNIQIKDVFAIDKTFSPIPLVTDSVDIMLYHPQFLVNSNQEPSQNGHVRIYPNPTSQYLDVQSPFAIEKAEIFNALGQSLFLGHYELTKEIRLDLGGNQRGIYFVTLHTAEGIVSQKVILD